MTRRRILTTTCIAAALALTLGGCMKMDMQIELQSDDTIDGTLTFAVAESLAELSGQSPEDLVEEMQEGILSSDNALGDVRSEPYTEEGFIGTKTFFEGAALDAIGSDAADDGLTIVRDGDDFVVTGEMDLSDADASQAALMTGMDLRIAVTFPGPVAEHNGELSANTVTWVPVPGERLEISARGSAEPAGAGGLPILAIVAIAVGLLALVAIVVVAFIVRSRRSSTPTDADHAPFVAPVTPGVTHVPDAAAPGTPAAPPAPPAPAAPEFPPTSPAAAPPVPEAPPVVPPASGDAPQDPNAPADGPEDPTVR